MKKLKIPTGVKCDQKVKERRTQIIEAARELFFEKGFHRTTTRELSKKANLSFGAIYEYIGSKEDILFLKLNINRSSTIWNVCLIWRERSIFRFKVKMLKE